MFQVEKVIKIHNVMFQSIYVRDYLNWIHDIQDKNALYNIDPIQTREWARRLTKGPLNPFVN